MSLSTVRKKMLRYVTVQFYHDTCCLGCEHAETDVKEYKYDIYCWLYNKRLNGTNRHKKCIKKFGLREEL